MRIRPRRSARTAPATTGTLRVAGSKGTELSDVEPGQVLVVDLADLTYAAAEAITQSGVSAVLNFGRLRAGRYANLGPAALADADLVWIDEVDGEAVDQLVDGASVRLHRGEIHLAGPGNPDSAGSDDDRLVAVGRELDLAALAGGSALGPVAADEGLALPPPVREPARASLRHRRPAGGVDDPVTPEPHAPVTPEPPHPVAPDIRDESEPSGAAPQLRTTIEDRPVVVMAMATATHRELRVMRRFMRNTGPVLIAVGEVTVEDLVGLGCAPQVVIHESGADDDVPSDEILSMATDVVLVSQPGRAPEVDESPAAGSAGPTSERRFHRVESAGSAVDVALRLAEQRGASIVVGVGLVPSEMRLGAVPFLDLSAVGDLAAPRRAATAVVAVLALLIGGGLGAAALDAAQAPPTPSASSNAATDDLVKAIRRQEADMKSAQSMVGALAPRVYGSGLAGQGVMVVGMPGAPTSEITGLSDQVRMAGGAASRSVLLQRSLFDPDDQTQVETVGSGLLAQLADPRLDAAATTYVRMGQLLALAMTTPGPAPAVADPTAVTIREALQSAGLARFPTDVRLAPTVLLVLPPGDADSRTDPALLADLVDGLATTAAAVVVVGDADSADPGGTLAGLRARTLSDRVSTVDGVDQPTGQLSMVLAMEAALTGVTGAYGASGADGPLPGTS